MEAFIASIIPIWGPAIAAVLSVVVSVCVALSKISAALTEFKQSAEMKELIAALKTQTAQNEELQRVNKLLVDEITKIKGYADSKLNKGE